MSEAPSHMKTPTQLLVAVRRYLGSRPADEVLPMVMALNDVLTNPEMEIRDGNSDEQSTGAETDNGRDAGSRDAGAGGSAS